MCSLVSRTECHEHTQRVVRCAPFILLFSGKNILSLFFLCVVFPSFTWCQKKMVSEKRCQKKKYFFLCVVFPSFTWCQKRMVSEKRCQKKKSFFSALCSRHSPGVRKEFLSLSFFKISSRNMENKKAEEICPKPQSADYTRANTHTHIPSTHTHTTVQKIKRARPHTHIHTRSLTQQLCKKKKCSKN